VQTTVISLDQGSEINTAAFIAKSLNDDWNANSLAFDGAPAFEINGIPYPLRLRAQQVGHLVNVWGEADFDLFTSFTGQTTACIVNEDVPVFPTINDAKRYGPIYGATFCTKKGEPFSVQQMADALLLGSAELISIADGEPLVACQFLHEFTGDLSNGGFNLDHYPIVRWDDPVLAGPLYFAITGSNTTILRKFFQVDCVTGCVKFIGLCNFYGPRLNNDTRLTVKMSYTAGLDVIHTYFAQTAVKLASMLNTPLDIYEKIQSETGSVQFRDIDKRTQQIRERLAGICGW